jgi:hypothetical protein
VAAFHGSAIGAYTRNPGGSGLLLERAGESGGIVAQCGIAVNGMIASSILKYSDITAILPLNLANFSAEMQYPLC